MIVDSSIGKIALMIFAMVCAWQDMKTMSIGYETIIAGFAVVLAGLIYTVRAGIPGVLPDMLMGCLPGVAILILSYVTGRIGAGDGLYFIIVGAAMGMENVMAVLFFSLFLNALIGGCMLLRMKITASSKTGKDPAEERLPFLPAAGVVLIVRMLIGG